VTRVESDLRVSSMVLLLPKISEQLLCSEHPEARVHCSQRRVVA